MVNLEDKKNHLSFFETIPNSLKSVLLLVIPLIYGALALFYYNQCGAFFACSPDPMYVYLINGANIASGNFDIGHIDHPGTPVQVVAALIIIITHFFVGGGTVIESVLAKPELYLSVCAIVLITVLFIVGFLSGKMVLKATRNMGLALFFQLIPFSSYWALHYSIRIFPEAFIIIYLTYYATFLWVLCYKRNNFSDNLPSNRFLILFFSFSTALLITIKVVCLPLLIIPFFFIKKFFQKVFYLIMTIIFAALLISPIWSKLPLMFNWFTGLATHAGNYGGGEKELLNVSSFKANLIVLFSTEVFFTIGYLLTSISVIAGLLIKKWKDNFYTLTLALWVTITAQILLVAKHYDYHYALTSQLLIIPAIVGAWAFLFNMRPVKNFTYPVFIICLFWLVFKTSQKAFFYSAGNQEYASSLVAKKYKRIPKIITTTWEKSCFPESALHYAACYGGDHFQEANLFLNKLYPNSYIYFAQGNMMLGWGTVISNNELVKKYPQILVYFFGKEEADEKSMLQKITAGSEPNIKDIQLVQHNKLSGESFYMIYIHTAK